MTMPVWQISNFFCCTCIYMYVYVCTVYTVYSQVHKYWDIDTILTFLALYTTTMDFKWNDETVFTSKSGERCRNYNSLHMCLPLVKGPKVMGQLASQLFHGQVCVIPSLSQLQWADKRSRVHFKCAICIWNLLLSTVKMRSKELSLSVKQAIIRLKKQNKPIREIATTLGVAKTTVWNILKKKERTSELSNTKRPGRPRKTTVVDDRRILSLVKKTPFTTVG